MLNHRRAARDCSPEDRAHIIRQSELAGGLSLPLLEEIAEKSTIEDVHRRRFIYRSGDAADSVFVIARGRVKICCQEARTEREAVIDIHSTGSLFGESALYASGKRPNCAVAYESVRLLCIPVREFQEGMANNKELYNYIFRLIGQRLDRAERRVADFSLDAISGRLEKLLLEFSERYGRREANGVLIDLPLPHREIASLVGSTRESVTVQLNVMRRAGMIDIVNRRILIKRLNIEAGVIVS